MWPVMNSIAVIGWKNQIIQMIKTIKLKVNHTLNMASTEDFWPGRGVSEKVLAVGFCLGCGLFGSCNSN